MQKVYYIYVVSYYICSKRSLRGDETPREVGERKCWVENLFGGDRNKNFVFEVLCFCLELIATFCYINVASCYINVADLRRQIS